MKRRVPILLIDMDGPLAAFDKKFYDLSREHFGPDTFDFDLDGSETDPQRFLTDNMRPGPASAMHSMVESTRWFRDLPVAEGAKAGMGRLRELVINGACEAAIATKPLEANPWCRDDKAAWLLEHFGKFWLNRLFITPNKSYMRGDLLLDDAIKPEWVSDPYTTWRPVVFDEPFNQPGTKHGADYARFSWSQSPYDLLHLALEHMQ